jgi:hypothetical protein
MLRCEPSMVMIPSVFRNRDWIDRETLVAACYDIVTAGENWVSVVASGGHPSCTLRGRSLGTIRDELAGAVADAVWRLVPACPLSGLPESEYRAGRVCHRLVLIFGGAPFFANSGPCK